MFATKNTIVGMAGLVGGIFGYTSAAASSETLAVIAAFGCMLACASMADFLTLQLEEDEDE